MGHYLYKLIPPRPTFDSDLSDDEAAIMGEHSAYWVDHLEQGRVMIFGPVSDPAGTWGLAVVEADSEDDVRALARKDPAIATGLATYEVFAMPSAVARS